MNEVEELREQVKKLEAERDEYKRAHSLVCEELRKLNYESNTEIRRLKYQLERIRDISIEPMYLWDGRLVAVDETGEVVS